VTATLDQAAADPRQTIAELQRQLAERDEALAQQTATADVLGVINSSPGDLAPVFDAILEKSLTLCEAVFGNLRIYDGECFHHAASHGASAEMESFHREPFTPNRGTLAERLVRGETVIHLPDLVDSDVYRTGAPGATALVEQAGARAIAESW
jgi:hypothetical protein